MSKKEKVTIKFWNKSIKDYIECDHNFKVDMSGTVTCIVEDTLGRKHEISIDNLVPHFYINDKRIG